MDAFKTNVTIIRSDKKFGPIKKMQAYIAELQLT